MSNPFGDSIQQSNDIKGNEDRLGGFRIHESDIYPAEIVLAYFGESKGGARMMNYEVKLPDGSKFSWVEYVTSGRDKGQKNYSEKDGEKSYLPGYIRANAIANMCAGKDLDKLSFEDKTLKLYNYDAKAEVPTPAKVAVELIGKTVYLGIHKVLTNKSVKGMKDGKEAWLRTAETKEENIVDKVFHYPKKLTLSEAVEKAEEPKFFDQWLERHKGKVINRVKEAETTAGTAGAPGQSGGANDKPSSSLFD